MRNLLATVAVGVVLALFGFALYWMTVGDYTAAGLCFLSASIVIYYRENRLVNG
jgi:tellurite resistance protein TehA-like permease